MVIEQTDSAPCRGGINYGILRYMSGSTDTQKAFNSLPKPEIALNYLGKINQFTDSGFFKHAEEFCGQVQSPRNSRAYVLVLRMVIFQDRLHMSFVYSTAQYQTSTIERLAEEVRNALCLLAKSGVGEVVQC